MAEFDLEQIKIGDDVYKIAAGGGGNKTYSMGLSITSSGHVFSVFDNSVSWDDLHVGDTLCFKGSTNYSGSRNSWNVLPKVEVGKEIRSIYLLGSYYSTSILISGAYSLTLTIHKITSSEIQATISIDKTGGYYRESSYLTDHDKTRICNKLVDLMGGGLYADKTSTSLADQIHVLKNTGSELQAIDATSIYYVYNLCEHELAYIVQYYNDDNALFGCRDFSYDGAEGYVSSVLATTDDKSSATGVVTFKRPSGVIPFYDEAASDYKFKLMTGKFGSNVAIFGMNGYTFG